MSGLYNIIRKELKELLTPATILPVIIIALIYGSLGSSMEGIQEEISQPPTIGIINLDPQPLGTLAATTMNTSANIIFSSDDITEKQDILQQLKEQDGTALIIIPHNFTSNILNDTRGTFEIYWVLKGAGVLGSISSEAVQRILYQASTQLSETLIEQNTTINSSIALYPTNRIETTYYKDMEFKGLSPGAITGILTQQSMMMSIMIMIIIAASAGTVISSMALEKENKTLETLLTLPVKRTHIVIGKIAASASIGLIFAVIFMVGMSRYLGGLDFSEQITSTTFDFQLTTPEILLIGISLFITLIAALSLAMLLGMFAKNYKSAQTLTFPITMLALVPMFLTMFFDFDTLPIAGKLVVFAIPFSHTMMAPRALIFNDYLLVSSGLIYVTIFAIVTISIVAWIFKTDRLLTSGSKPKIFTGKKRLFKR